MKLNSWAGATWTKENNYGAILKAKNNYWTILRKRTIMEPFWEKTTIEPFWEKHQLWNHLEEEKMQLLNRFEERAIIEQFQKKNYCTILRKKGNYGTIFRKTVDFEERKKLFILMTLENFQWTWFFIPTAVRDWSKEMSTPPSSPEITILHRFGPKINTQNRTTRICRFCWRGWILPKRPTFGHVIIFWWRCSVHL